MLEIDGLTAGYDEAAVVRDLDLTVGPGEVVALLGANGAGKTTTLRAVSGIVHPMSGRTCCPARTWPADRRAGGHAWGSSTCPRAGGCSSA